MNNKRPINSLVTRSLDILKKEYIVIGKEHIPSRVAWIIIGVTAGLTVAIAFLASRSGTFEETRAATQLPKGYLDGIDAKGFTWGWAYDPDVPSQSIDVHAYIDGTFFLAKSTLAYRKDVNDAFGITGNHGFDFTIPSQYQDGKQHTLNVYAIDSSGAGPNPNVTYSPKTFTLGGGTSCNTTFKDNTFHACFFDGISAPLSASSVLTQSDDVTVPSPVGSWSGFEKNYGAGQVANTGKSDQVSGVWRAKVNFQAGTYVFHTTSDDGVELTIDGFGSVISNWTDHGLTQNDSTSINLPAGPRNVTLRWYENTGGAYIKVWWERSGGSSTLPPKGYLDGIDAKGFTWGWAYDPDVPSQSIDVHAYIDGTFFLAKSTLAYRKDVNDAFGITGNHGFDFTIPSQYQDGKQHTLNVYAIDSSGAGPNPNVTYSPKTFTVGGGGSITVKKMYIEVTRNDAVTQVKLDTTSFSPGNPAVFTNVAGGSRSVSVQVPAGMKAFFALCPGKKNCDGPVKGGMLGPGTIVTDSFVHEAGKNDTITIFFCDSSCEYGHSFIPLDLHHLLGVQDAYAVSGVVPGRGSWFDSRSVDFTTCNRKFVALDPTTTGELYSVLQNATQNWSLLTKAILVADRNSNYATATPYQLQNNRAVYKEKDVDKVMIDDEGKQINVVAFTDTSNGAPWLKSEGGASIYGFVRAVIPEDEKSYDNFRYFKFITGTNIVLRPSILSSFLKNKAVTHELGHAIGLGHGKDVSSIMTTVGFGYEEYITINDRKAVDALYPNCAASLRLSFSPNPAVWGGPGTQGFGASCKNRDGARWWGTVMSIEETSGKASAVLEDRFPLLYWLDPGYNFENVQASLKSLTRSGSGSSKGFPDDLYVPPGGRISADICQLPWDPELLDTLEFDITGKDSLGHSMFLNEKLDLGSNKSALLFPGTKIVTKTAEQALTSIFSSLAAGFIPLINSLGAHW